jgi:hypothetical protein
MLLVAPQVRESISRPSNVHAITYAIPPVGCPAIKFAGRQVETYAVGHIGQDAYTSN